MALVSIANSDVSVLIPAQPKEMISVGVTPDGRTLVRINSSSLSVIQECLRKSQYLLLEGWKPESEHPATIFGSAMHKAMEVFYAAPPEERELSTLERLEEVSFNVLNGNSLAKNLTEKAVAAFTTAAKPLSPLPDTDKRSIINGVWVLYHYFKSYISDPYSVYVDEKGPFLERTFTYRLVDTDKLVIDLFGTIDFIFRHITEGSLLPGDHKTTSSLNFNGSSYFDREKPNHQYTGYLLAVNQVFRLNTSEFMINAIEVKAKPKTARGSAPNFPRQVTRRDADDYTEFEEVVVKVVNDYLYAMKHSQWPLGPVSACNQYGGCSYKAVCAAPKQLRHNILKSKFTQQKGVNP